MAPFNETGCGSTKAVVAQAAALWFSLQQLGHFCFSNLQCVTISSCGNRTLCRCTGTRSQHVATILECSTYTFGPTHQHVCGCWDSSPQQSDRGWNCLGTAGLPYRENSLPSVRGDPLEPKRHVMEAAMRNQQGFIWKTTNLGASA